MIIMIGIAIFSDLLNPLLRAALGLAVDI